MSGKTASEKTPRTTAQASPMRSDASQTEGPGNSTYRACKCGCGQKFIPAKKHHVFYSDHCRRNAWVNRNAGAVAVSRLRKENAAILAQLERVEKELGAIKQALKDNAIEERS